MFKAVVQKENARVRLDLFLVRELPQYSRSRIQQLIRTGFVRLNGAATRPHQLVRAADEIEVSQPPLEKVDIRPEPIALDVLFEDNDLIVINKPAGLIVHPGAGQREHTLVNALLSHCTTLSGIGGVQRPGIVHRLDKETSGCLVVAKNDSTHQALALQFAHRKVDKVYLSIVCGEVPRLSGDIRAAISRHSSHRKRMAVADDAGRAAWTSYRVLERLHC